VEDYQPMSLDFSDEDISALFHADEYNHEVNIWTLFFDGASNVMGHGIGAVLISLENQYIPVTTRLCFDCTNNIAKYEACPMGIRAAIEYRVKILEVYGDSALVFHQIKDEWRLEIRN